MKIIQKINFYLGIYLGIRRVPHTNYKMQEDLCE